MAIIPLTISAAGVSAPAAIPSKTQNWSGIGVSCLMNFSGNNIGGGPAGIGTVTLQVSNDPTAVSSPTTARWNNHDTLVNVTADKNSSIVFPLYAARLYCSAYTSGTIVCNICIPDQL